jgi:hypothetical protein
MSAALRSRVLIGISSPGICRVRFDADHVAAVANPVVLGFTELMHIALHRDNIIDTVAVR